MTYFGVVLAHFVRRLKIDMLCCKFQTLVFLKKWHFVPFYRSTPQSSHPPLPTLQRKTTHGTVGVIFEVFRREPENRHVVLQTSNARISTKRRITPFSHSTPQPSHSPLPVDQISATHTAPFQHRFDLFCTAPKIDRSQTP